MTYENKLKYLLGEISVWDFIEFVWRHLFLNHYYSLGEESDGVVEQLLHDVINENGDHPLIVALQEDVELNKMTDLEILLIFFLVYDHVRGERDYSWAYINSYLAAALYGSRNSSVGRLLACNIMDGTSMLSKHGCIYVEFQIDDETFRQTGEYKVSLNPDFYAKYFKPYIL